MRAHGDVCCTVTAGNLGGQTGPSGGVRGLLQDKKSRAEGRFTACTNRKSASSRQPYVKHRNRPHLHRRTLRPRERLARCFVFRAILRPRRDVHSSHSRSLSAIQILSTVVLVLARSDAISCACRLRALPTACLRSLAVCSHARPRCLCHPIARFSHGAPYV